MINTNSIIELSQTAQTVKTQLSPWLPALAIAAAWLGRELNRLSIWSANAAEKIIAHGGLIKIIGKLFYNKSA